VLHEAVHVGIPTALNLASLGLAVFMLTVWLRRRSEVALGCFGAAALIMALRNLAYFIEIEPTPPGVMDGLLYLSHVANAVLFGLFGRAVAGRRGRAYLWLLGALALVLPLCAAVCVTLDYANLPDLQALSNAATRMGLLRRWTYPMLLLAMLPSVAWILGQARQQPRSSLVFLAAGIGALLLGAANDYASLVGQVLLTRQYIQPFVFPLAMGAMSIFLVARMVAATGAAEALARELDERVAQRTQQLSLANAAKTRFLTTASHDLRQPVMTISLLVSLLRQKVNDAAATQRLVGKLQGATQSLESLLSGLMDLSRLDPLLVEARLQPVPLQAVFEAIALHEKPQADRKGLRLRFRPTPLVVRADPVLLEQALRNLVSNALRYTRQGGVLVVARAQGPAGVRLQVWDTGIGIAAPDQARVFEEFVQLGNPGRDRSQGLGMGLAIVQRSAAAMGASVGLRSTPGRGSCFSLDLPRLPAASADEREGPPPAEAGTRPLHGHRLWVLDNDEALREALVWRLQAWGADVQALSSLAALQDGLGQVAGSAAARPALLLTDQRLGDGTGSDAIRLLQQALGADVPGILVTDDALGARAQALARQGVPVLAKPASDLALLAAIEQSLSKAAG
jgi:signal transduction histidine kinase/CheY-like chemotaxis protein